MEDTKMQDLLEALDVLRHTQEDQVQRIHELRRKLEDAELEYRATSRLIERMLNLPVREFV